MESKILSMTDSWHKIFDTSQVGQHKTLIKLKQAEIRLGCPLPELIYKWIVEERLPVKPILVKLDIGYSYLIKIVEFFDLLNKLEENKKLYLQNRSKNSKFIINPKSTVTYKENQ